MMRAFLVLIAATVLVGCGTMGSRDSKWGSRRCGLIGCITSPDLKARLSPQIVGRPLSEVIQRMGPPDKTYQDGTNQYLSWVRTNNTADFGTLSCTETVTARASTVVNYRFDGNC